MKGNEMENREKIAEWIRNPEMEAAWFDTENWFTFDEYRAKWSILRLNGLKTIKTRKRKTPIDAFMDELTFNDLNKHESDGNWIVLPKESIRELAEKHFGYKRDGERI